MSVIACLTAVGMLQKCMERVGLAILSAGKDAKPPEPNVRSKQGLSQTVLTLLHWSNLGQKVAVSGSEFLYGQVGYSVYSNQKTPESGNRVRLGEGQAAIDESRSENGGEESGISNEHVEHIESAKGQSESSRFRF